MKSILMSIQPQWVEKILNGDKTIEIRKTIPKCELPFRVYVYCTKNKPYLSTDANNRLNGKVVGEFIVDKIDKYKYDYQNIISAHRDCDGDLTYRKMFFYYMEEKDLKNACLTYNEVFKYGKEKDLYGYHISQLKIYDKPKKLNEFKKPCIMPDKPYCPCCEFGHITHHGDTTKEDLINGCDCEWNCLNYIKKAPQSWCYVEEV